MAAHGYCFLQSNFSHDSLNEFNGDVIGNGFKFMTGRFLSPINRMVFRTSLTIPWLIGVLSLLWIGLSVFLTLRIFHIESKVLAFLVSGIYTANLTVSCTAATFIHDLDSDMLALLFSVIAVYVWSRWKWGWLVGAVSVMASLAFYQSYITVTIVLVMFVCILDVINQEDFPVVFFKGMKAIAMLLLGGFLYFIGMKLARKIVGMEMMTGQYNTLDRPLGMTMQDFVYLTKMAYQKYFKRMATALSPYPASVTNAITFVLFIILMTAILAGLCNRKTPIIEKLLCLGLVALLPFAMNLMHILTYGSAHELMRFAYWLSYLLVILSTDWFEKWLEGKMKDKKWKSWTKLPSVLSIVLVSILLYSNVQVANVFYLKKDLENKAYMSLMTRITYKMEDYDGYKPGETPVVITGLPEQFNSVLPGFEDYTMPNGVQVSDVLTFATRERFEAYYDYYLNTPILLADGAVWNQYKEDSRVQQMPNYPEDGCISMLENVLVVKLGDSDF